MFNKSDCRIMREVMMFTAKKILRVLFWGGITSLMCVLIFRTADFIFTFISQKDYIQLKWFAWTLGGACILSIVIGVFMFICAIISTAQLKGEDVTVNFLFIGLGYSILPMVVGIMLAIYSCYLPSENLPHYLNNLLETIKVYTCIFALICFFAGCIRVVINSH